MKKMNWKRAGSLLFALLLLVAPLSACSSDDEPDEPETPAESVPVVLDDVVATEDFGIAFRKGDVLRDQVNGALKVLKADGTVERIATEWFGHDITTIQADANALDGVEEPGERTFYLGLDDSFPPMGYRDGSNNIVGFDIDLAQAVCDYFGWTLVPTPIDWSAKEMELESGNIDCIWNGMTLTEERMEQMDCSDPYMANEQVLVVMSDSGHTSMDDLAGGTVALQSGSSAQDALDDNESFKDSLDSVAYYGNNLECFMDLEQGGVDAVLVDSVVANYYVTTGDTSALE